MTKKTPVEKKIWEQLEEVHDPELFISIVDLGLVYNVSEADGAVDVRMTLTTLGCPLFALIEKDVKDKVSSVKGINKVHVDLVFDPPWNVEMMSERGKAMMGI